MGIDLDQMLGRLVKQVVHNLERWEAASPNPHEVFVGMAGGAGPESAQGKTKTIHEIVRDVREGNPEGQALLGALLENMMSQAVETRVGGAPPPFDATAFEAELDATREARGAEAPPRHSAEPRKPTR